MPNFSKKSGNYSIKAMSSSNHSIRIAKNLAIFFCFLPVSLLFLFACAGLRKAPVIIPPAEGLPVASDVIEQLKQQNRTLKTFKGIGTVRLDQKGIRQSFRMAWTGARPTKFHIIIQNAFGQPALNLAGDGEYLYFFSFDRKPEFFKKQSSNPNLNSFISVPIKVDEVLSFLSGRTPIYKYDHAILEKSAANDGFVLILKKRWLGLRQKIYLNNDKEVYKVDTFDIKGALAYRAELNRFQTVNGYTLPFQIVLSTADGNRFQLNVDRYWADVSVSPEMFVLTPYK